MCKGNLPAISRHSHLTYHLPTKFPCLGVPSTVWGAGVDKRVAIPVSVAALLLLILHVSCGMATNQTQKALLLPSRGGRWYVGEQPIPRPGPQEVLVKIISTALNPADWRLVDSPVSDFISAYPFVSGTDGAGIVEEVGEEVTTVKNGDRM